MVNNLHATNSNHATVMVVDDNDAFRQSVVWLLQSEGYRVDDYADAETALSALEQVTAPPDCLVTDVRMPGMNGLQLQRKLKQMLKQGHDSFPILFMTAHGDVPLAVEAMREGAIHFFEKPFADEDFLEAVAQACERTDSLELREEVINAITPREHQVLERVVAGVMNKVIADQLGISIKTVEMHRANVKLKLGAKNLAELVQIAVKR